MSARRALLAVGALSFAAASVGSATPAATSKHLFRPFVGGKLSAGVHVVRARRGYCWTGSGAAYLRRDAWRCFIGNEIYDPCFADPSGSVTGFVVCSFWMPWSNRVVKILLTRRLPASQRNPGGAVTRRDPWAVKLRSGKGCTTFTGATGTIAGKGVHYGCVGGGYLLASPRRARTWTITYAASYKARSTRRVAIAEAWW
jgi:hypothetical protein